MSRNWRKSARSNEDPTQPKQKTNSSITSTDINGINSYKWDYIIKHNPIVCCLNTTYLKQWTITFQNEEDAHGVLGKHKPKESTCCQIAFKERETHDKNHYMWRRSHNKDRGVNEDLCVKSRSSNTHEAEVRKEIRRNRNTLVVGNFSILLIHVRIYIR